MRFDMRLRVGIAITIHVSVIAACARTASESPPPAVATTPDVHTAADARPVESATLAAAPVTSTPLPAPDPVPAPLPEGITPGEETRLAVPRDRAAIVVHAPAGVRGAIVYLHGVCGDAYAPRSWYGAATRYGTLITLLGDDACKGRPGRFRWRKNNELLQSRIDRALAAVKEARGGQLDTEELTIIGYSQGASRAEAVALRELSRCKRVVLGSPPSAPDPDDFSPEQSIAVVAGALENNDVRREGVERLRAAGVRATFMPLPGAYHGQYGAEGERVMGEALAWLHGET